MPQQNLKCSTDETQAIYDAAPVLKWAGGKSQLLPALREHLPPELHQNKIKTFIEPFVGSGAVFFDLVNNFTFQKIYLFDINPELVILYNSLKDDVETVVKELGRYQDLYLKRDEDDRKIFFYEIREKYNDNVLNVHSSLKKQSSSFQTRSDDYLLKSHLF